MRKSTLAFLGRLRCIGKGVLLTATFCLAARDGGEAAFAEVSKPQVAVAQSGLLIRHNARVAKLVRTLTSRTEGMLADAGIPYSRIDDAAFAAGALDKYSIAILPYNRIDDGAARALESFVSRGGKIIASFTTGSSRVYDLLGLRQGQLARPSFDGQFERIRFTDSARRAWPSLPASMRQDSWNAFAVQLLPGTEAIARWEGKGRRTLPAVTRNRAGIYVTHIFTGADRAAKSRFLLSCVIGFRPELWATIMKGSLDRAEQQMTRAEARWEKARDMFRPSRRKDIDDSLAGFRRRLDSLKTASRDGAKRAAALDGISSITDQIRRGGFAMMPSRKHEIRGIWFFRGGTTDWDAVMSNLKAHGLNCIFVRVSRAGKAIHKSDVIPQADWAKALDHDEVAAGIASAHRHGVEFHAWHVAYHAGSASKGYMARLKAEDRVVRDRNGKQSYWLNPADPRNMEYECRAMAELVRKYDVDGIHWDYIRYPDSPHYNFDYGPVSRREFEKAAGRRVAEWPEDVISGGLKYAYEDWERANVSKVVQRVYREAKRIKPWVQVSAAVWRRPRKCRHTIKQDWPRWVEKGWLDFLVPMDYARTPGSLDRILRDQMPIVGGRTPIGVGIGSWLLSQPEDLLDQVELARSVGGDGFVLFSHNAGNLPSQLAALHAGATAEPATPSFRSPRFACFIPGGLRRKGQPRALVEGAKAPVTITLLHTSAYRKRVKRVASSFSIENLQGRRVADIETVPASDKKHLGEIVVPSGSFRPMARGHVEFADGTRRSYVWRGPIFEGVTAGVMAELTKRRFPPKVMGKGLRVGIYAGGLGAEKLLAGLRGTRGLKVFHVHRLRSDHLAVARGFILPQLGDVDDLTTDAIAALRQWVESGGRLILTHDAVGFRWHMPMFAEVGKGATRSSTRKVVTAARIGRRQAGWAFEHSYLDHVRLAVGENGRVLATEAPPSDAPVIVAGPVGKGLVVLSGILPAYTEEDLTAVEKELLVGLLTLRTERD